MAPPHLNAEVTLYRSSRHYSTVSALSPGPGLPLRLAQTCGRFQTPCGPPDDCCNWLAGETCCGPSSDGSSFCCNTFVNDCKFTSFGGYLCMSRDFGGGGGDGGYGDGCFVSGTLISTRAGLVEIENIEVGDEVCAYDFERRTVRFQRVSRVFRAHSERLVILDFGADRVVCTPRHRFFADSWKAAGQLCPDDLLMCRNGESMRLLSSEVDERHEPVFNLRVEEDSNYFVGSAGLVVHNDKIEGDGSEEDFCAQFPEACEPAQDFRTTGRPRSGLPS